MGTETSFKMRYRPPQKITEVKLNNPLMGTETWRFVFSIILFRYRFVKLNNPLMGTETQYRVH